MIPCHIYWLHPPPRTESASLGWCTRLCMPISGPPGSAPDSSATSHLAVAPRAVCHLSELVPYFYTEYPSLASPPPLVNSCPLRFCVVLPFSRRPSQTSTTRCTPGPALHCAESPCFVLCISSSFPQLVDFPSFFPENKCELTMYLSDFCVTCQWNRYFPCPQETQSGGQPQVVNRNHQCVNVPSLLCLMKMLPSTPPPPLKMYLSNQF